jgi:hypothetical protein
MTINLSQLKELMSPLTRLCQREREVDLKGIKVFIKHLTPKEELEVQKMLPELEGSSAIEFADVFRRETLARSIIQVGDLDLRGLKEIETGETLPNGKAVKVSKEEAVVQVMDSWSKYVLAKLFEQYGLLSEEIEKGLDESLKINIEDTESEKEILKERLDNLDVAQKLENLEDNEKEVP